METARIEVAANLALSQSGYSLLDTRYGQPSLFGESPGISVYTLDGKSMKKNSDFPESVFVTVWFAGVSQKGKVFSSREERDKFTQQLLDS